MKTTKHPLGTLVETDVLVIGSGASGCGAALGARDQGLDVVLMDKGKLESSGCIGVNVRFGRLWRNWEMRTFN